MSSVNPTAGHGEVAIEFHPAEEPHHTSPTLLGFWIYLMSDCLIFAVLFATRAVVGANYADSPLPKDLFDIELIMVSTFALLFSSITYGFAVLKMQDNHLDGTLKWLAITGLFGAIFIGIELYEFNHLFHAGATPQSSASWSSFYALVGTHGLHVTFGLVWLVVLMVQAKQYGLTVANKRRLLCLSMFWHFLDLVWLGVYSLVYLTGVLI